VLNDCDFNIAVIVYTYLDTDLLNLDSKLVKILSNNFKLLIYID